jgi:hypothetical protein
MRNIKTNCLMVENMVEFTHSNAEIKRMKVSQFNKGQWGFNSKRNGKSVEFIPG